MLHQGCGYHLSWKTSPGARARHSWLWQLWQQIGVLQKQCEYPAATAPRLRTASIKKDRRVIVVGDSLLKGTEGSICQPDPTRREVCCLPGAKVRDVARMLPNLVHPSDYYPLLIVQAGSDDIEERSLKTI